MTIFPNGNTRRGRTDCNSELGWGLEAARMGANPSGMHYNTATFPHSDWPLHEAIGAPPSPNAYLTRSFFVLPSFSPQRPPSSRMCKKHKDHLIHVHAHVHPPFPSFAWVMTAQANPPSLAYSYGYIQNARTLHTRLPAHRATPPGRHRPYPRSSRPTPSPARARAKIEPCDEKFMVSRSGLEIWLVAVDEC